MLFPVCAVYESEPTFKEGGGWLTGFHRELGSRGISFPHASRKLSIQEILSRTKLQLISTMVCPGNPSSMFWNSQLKITRVRIANLKVRMHAQGVAAAWPQPRAQWNLAFLSWLLHSTLELLPNVAVPLKYWYPVVWQTVDSVIQENIFRDVNKREPMRWLSSRPANTRPPVVLRSTTNCQMQN